MLSVSAHAQGYSGLIPSPDSAQEEPRGYSGVIPGAVRPAPQSSYPSSATTALGGSEPSSQPPSLNAQDLQNMAAVQANRALMEKNLLKGYEMPPEAAAALHRPRIKIEGMTLYEMTIQRRVDEAMAEIENPGLTPVQRTKIYPQVLAELQSIEQGVRRKKNVRRETYENMGYPALYINEQQSATAAAHRRVLEALNRLQRFNR